MATTIRIPEAFQDWMIKSNGAAGAAWIASIPEALETLANQWKLANPGSPLHGGASLVIPVTWKNKPAVLKLASSAPASQREALALRHWRGNGMVQLLNHDADLNALLLERVGPEHLDILPVQDAVQQIAQLLRQTAIAPHPDVPTVMETASAIAAHLDTRWERMGRPFPARLVDACKHLIADHSNDPTMLMVNKDLHYRNVLRGQRLSWIAIDPQPYAGPPEFAVASILIRTVDLTTGPPAFRQVVSDIIETASLDPGKTIDWTIVRTVDYWLWALENGLTEDPVRCATVLEWLDEKMPR